MPYLRYFWRAEQVANHLHRSLSIPRGGTRFNSSSSTFDRPSSEELHEFERGRFVFDEANQKAIRRVQFNMDNLRRAAAEAIDAKECTSVQKCPDGLYNKSFIMTMDDGREVIAKIPNPNAGIDHYTTASEVATMDFARNELKIPAPSVFAWNSRAATSPVGSEFIIMEKIKGIQLQKVWPQLRAQDKLQILLTVSRYHKAWLNASFASFGGLYYPGDLSVQARHNCIYTAADGETTDNSRFAIGPAAGREWSDDGRSLLDCDRGSWTSVVDYRKAIALREIAAIENSPQLLKQMAMICGPGLYVPTKSKKLASLRAYLKVFEKLLPSDPSISASHLWHNDLHDENIFVDPETPTRITGVIDWQSCQLLPLFDHNPDPGFLDYSGELSSLERPKMPDTSGLSEEEQAAAIKEFSEKSMFVMSRRLARDKNPVLFRTTEFQSSEPYNVLFLARRIFEVGEAHLMAQILEIRDSWKDIPAVRDAGNPPYPLDFSDEQLAEMEADYDAATRGIMLVEEFKSRLGELWPDKGVVRHDQYEEAKAALRQLRKEVVAHVVSNEEERKEFERFWPFES